MSQFHLQSTNPKLRCPYKGCKKVFEKPTLLSDASLVPRQTYHAVPHYMSKLGITVKKERIISVETIEYPVVLDTPAKCANYTESFSNSPENAPLSNVCEICPKILQWNLQKRQ